MRQHSTTRFQIREATEADAARISEVLRLAFAEFEALYTPPGFAATTPGPEMVLARMTEGPVWIAVRCGAVIGTVSAVLKADGCYIRGMAVLPQSRVQGIGRRLLEVVEDFAMEHARDRLHLSTTPFLDCAIHLYSSFGFQRDSDGDLFGTPLFTMTKALAGPRGA